MRTEDVATGPPSQETRSEPTEDLDLFDRPLDLGLAVSEVAEDPSSVPRWHNLGMALRKMGLDDAARAVFRRAYWISLDSDVPTEGHELAAETRTHFRCTCGEKFHSEGGFLAHVEAYAGVRP